MRFFFAGPICALALGWAAGCVDECDGEKHTIEVPLVDKDGMIRACPEVCESVFAKATRCVIRSGDASQYAECTGHDLCDGVVITSEK